MLFGAGSGLSGRNENPRRRRDSDRYSYRCKSAKATVPTARSAFGTRSAADSGPDHIA